MPLVNITETAPDGTQRTYQAEAPQCSREEIDIYGSIVCGRAMQNGYGQLEAMNIGAQWSADNEKTIDEAILMGLEGEGVVNYVVAYNLKKVREESTAQPAAPEPPAAPDRFTPVDFIGDQPTVDPDHAIYINQGEVCFDRARVLAFWLRSQLKDAIDDLESRDLIALSSIIGPDCQLVGRAAFDLNLPETPHYDLEATNPSDSPAAR